MAGSPYPHKGRAFEVQKLYTMEKNLRNALNLLGHSSRNFMCAYANPGGNNIERFPFSLRDLAGSYNDNSPAEVDICLAHILDEILDLGVGKTMRFVASRDNADYIGIIIRIA